jgi:hypothetical protein
MALSCLQPLSPILYIVERCCKEPLWEGGYDGNVRDILLGEFRCNPENYDVSWYDTFDCDHDGPPTLGFQIFRLHG